MSHINNEKDQGLQQGYPFKVPNFLDSDDDLEDDDDVWDNNRDANSKIVDEVHELLHEEDTEDDLDDIDDSDRVLESQGRKESGRLSSVGMSTIDQVEHDAKVTYLLHYEQVSYCCYIFFVGIFSHLHITRQYLMPRMLFSLSLLFFYSKDDTSAGCGTDGYNGHYSP